MPETGLVSLIPDKPQDNVQGDLRLKFQEAKHSRSPQTLFKRLPHPAFA
jgi:hypothetical protein